MLLIHISWDSQHYLMWIRSVGPVSRRYLFAMFFFLTFVEGYCLIYVRCTWHSGASKEALACIADKKTKFIPVRMSCRTLYLARMGKWYHLLLLTLPLKQLQLFLCMS
jgi:hypothetical protein